MKRHLAFTLIELLVVVAVFLVILAAIYAVLTIGRQSWYNSQTMIELQQQARRAIDSMTEELRESGAGNLTINAAGDQITFQIPVDWDADVDVIDNNGNIEWGAEDTLGWAIRYRLGGINNRQLLRQVLNAYPNGAQVGQDIILANHIRSDTPPPFALRFRAIPATTMYGIEVTAQKDALPGRALQVAIPVELHLRN